MQGAESPVIGGILKLDVQPTGGDGVEGVLSEWVFHYPFSFQGQDSPDFPCLSSPAFPCRERGYPQLIAQLGGSSQIWGREGNKGAQKQSPPLRAQEKPGPCPVTPVPSEPNREGLGRVIGSPGH